MTRQRYISDELTHFVGSKLPPDDRYGLLLKILNEGWLLAGGPEGRRSEVGSAVKIDRDRPLSSNKMINPDMVCFCDIPVGDFAIHMEKYSRFGVAFSKKYLLEKKGAAPVHYVPLGQRSAGHTGQLAFDKLGKAVEGLPRTDQASLLLMTSIQVNVLSFLQFFDASKAEDDPENYYMEREWRTLTSIQFRIEEVERIILPREYGRRLRDDVPSYSGQVAFVE
jgi:hypothetical protein